MRTRRLLLLVLSSGLIAQSALAARPAPSPTEAAARQTWRCAYKGRWSAEGGKGGGEFAWKVQWRGFGANWSLGGQYEDAFGPSTLSGGCRDGKCKVSQTYATGQLAGATYDWFGTYTDQAVAPDRTLNTFAGTWRRRGGEARGPWSATAECQLVRPSSRAPQAPIRPIAPGKGEAKKP